MKVISFIQSSQTSKMQEHPESIKPSIRKCPQSPIIMFSACQWNAISNLKTTKQNNNKKNLTKKTKKETLLIPGHESSTKYQPICVLYYYSHTCNEHYCFTHLLMPISVHSVINLILKYSLLWYHFKMSLLMLFTSPFHH